MCNILFNIFGIICFWSIGGSYGLWVEVTSHPLDSLFFNVGWIQSQISWRVLRPKLWLIFQNRKKGPNRVLKPKRSISPLSSANDPSTFGVHLKPSVKWPLKNKTCDHFYLGKDPCGSGFKKKERVGDPSTSGKGSVVAWRSLAACWWT